MLRKSYKSVAVALAVLIPWSLMAAEVQGATVSSRDRFLVNDRTVTTTTAIFPGDRLAAPDASPATISSSGALILMVKQSALTYRGKSVMLDPKSAIEITTTSGMAAEIGDLRISPNGQGPAQYQVARYNGEVVVNAVRGNVLIADASGPHVIPEGKAATLSDPDQQKAGSVPATTGIQIGHPPLWLERLLAFGLVAGTGAIVYWTLSKGGKQPVSPSVP